MADTGTRGQQPGPQTPSAGLRWWNRPPNTESSLYPAEFHTQTGFGPDHAALTLFTQVATDTFTWGHHKGRMYTGNEVLQQIREWNHKKGYPTYKAIPCPVTDKPARNKKQGKWPNTVGVFDRYLPVEH